MINYIFSFIEVVKAGGFSRAAKQIGLSKAQLSRHVVRLENELGIQLLYRTTRSLSLTEQGKQFYLACQGIEEQYDTAVNALKENFALMKGTLKITAPVDFGIEFLPNIIHKFNEQYPNITIVLSLSNKNEDLLLENYDLAIRIANQLPDSDLRVRPLFEFRRIICASPLYLKQIKRKPKHIEELKKHRCITSVNYRVNTIKPQWQFYVDRQLTSISLENVTEVDSLFAQLKLIQLGAGIGRIPDYFISEELKKGKLVELFSNVEKPRSFVYLLYPNLKNLPKKTELFMEFLKGRF